MLGGIMVHRETQVTYTTGTLGPLSIAELRILNIHLKTWLKDQGTRQTEVTATVEKAIGYFDHIIDTETQVGKLT